MSQLADSGHFLGLAKMVVVGIANTVAGYAIIFGLTAFSVDPLLSNIAGYTFGWALAFFLQRGWVFNGRRPKPGVEWRYVFSVSSAFLVNLAILRFAIDAGLSVWISQIGAGCGYTIVMYLAASLWVFRDDRGS